MAIPSTTHALLVGIDQYDKNSRLTKLSGPVKDVHRFAKWLIDLEVPTANITVLLSPSKESQDTAQEMAKWFNEESLPRATEENVKNALKKFEDLNNQGKKKEEQGNEKTTASYLLFWRGHGEVTGDVQRLYYADTSQSLRNLNLTQELTAMRSSLYVNEQVVIVDACANERVSEVTQLPNVAIIDEKNLAVGQANKDHQQLVMFAAVPGEEAFNQGETGVFTDSVLKELGKSSKETFPLDSANMKEIMRRVQEEFEKRRQEGKAQQSPSYEIYMTNGIKERVKQPEQKQIRKDGFGGLPFRQKNDLVRELLTCPSLINRSSRNRIIDALIPPIPNTVEREGSPREVVFSILEQCDLRDGGFISFLQALEVEEDSSNVFQQVERYIKNLFSN